MDRTAPTWKWGYWGQPRVVQVTADSKREVRHDLIEHIDRAKAFVQLDDTGKLRDFDGKGEDSTGATFKLAASGAEIPDPAQPAIAAFTPRHDGNSGVTVAEYNLLAIANVTTEDRKPASPPPLPNGVRLIPNLDYAQPDGRAIASSRGSTRRSARPTQFRSGGRSDVDPTDARKFRGSVHPPLPQNGAALGLRENN
jgi:hypothetical protein